MSRKKKAEQPVPLKDSDLDQASGGVLIALLLPAVQKAPEASPQLDTTQAPAGGINVVLGDGSVRKA